MEMSPVYSSSVSSENENSGGQPVTEVWGLGWRWAVRPSGPLAPLSAKTSLAKWHRTNPTLFGPQFPLPSLKGKEYSFFLSIQHCQPWKFSHCCRLGWRVQNYRSSLPKEEIEETVGERDGRSNSLVSIHPSLPFSLQPPCLWFGESFIPPIMLCIGAGWEGGVYGLTSCCCCCFLHAFLIKTKKKQKECLWFYLPGAGVEFLFCQSREKGNVKSFVFYCPSPSFPHRIWLWFFW